MRIGQKRIMPGAGHLYSIILCASLMAGCEDSPSDETIAAATSALEAEVKDTGRIDQAISGFPAINYTSKDTTADLREWLDDLLENVHLGSLQQSLDPKKVTGVWIDVELFGPNKAPTRMERFWERAGERVLRWAPTRQAAASCPIVIDAGQGTTINLQYKGGCSLPDGTSAEGAVIVAGTSDPATGDLKLGVQFDGWKVSSTLKYGAFNLAMNGKGLYTATGLTTGTSSFSVKRDFVASTDISAGTDAIKCPLESHSFLSGSATQFSFEVMDDGSCTGANAERLKLSRIKGTATQNADGSATTNASGEFVFYASEQQDGAKARIAIELKDVVYDPAQCKNRPARSGKIILGGSPPVTFDITGCGSYKIAATK